MDTTNAVADIDSGLAVILKRLILSKKRNGLPSENPVGGKPPMCFKPVELVEETELDAIAARSGS